MGLKIGIDVGGTFTDFIIAGEGPEALIHKVLSTPGDASLAVIAGLEEIAAKLAPHVKAAAAWLGQNWHKLVAVVGLAV